MLPFKALCVHSKAQIILGKKTLAADCPFMSSSTAGYIGI